MTAANELDTPIDGIDSLLEPFFQAETCRSRWRVGTEAEKFGVFLRDQSPIGYSGDRGVMTVFRALQEQHGWFEEREHNGGDIISLRRGGASITLEPGCQLELSGAPQETIHQTYAEFSGHMAELRNISEELGLVWLGLGFHPFAGSEDLDWVPKQRYRVMRSYLPTRGEHALDMMQRTATVQANFDYASEADAMRKLRLALRVSPIVTAMFANSPWVEGKRSGFLSSRAATWLAVDPDRAGLLPFAWDHGRGYKDYVEWALGVPMFLIKREGKVVHNTGQTFRAFMRDGFDGHVATHSDWQQHLNTLFPEVRLKKTLEVRCADGQGSRLTCALPALWKGLLYDEEACSKAEALVEALTFQDAEAARRSIASKGMRARLKGREVSGWARDLLDIAEAGLRRTPCLDQNRDDESIHTRALRDLVDAGSTPAERLLGLIEAADSPQQAILEHARI